MLWTHLGVAVLWNVGSTLCGMDVSEFQYNSKCTECSSLLYSLFVSPLLLISPGFILKYFSLFTG